MPRLRIPILPRDRVGQILYARCVEEAETFTEDFQRGIAAFEFGDCAADDDVAGVLSRDLGFKNAADCRAGAICGNEEFGGEFFFDFGVVVLFALEVNADALAFVDDVGDGAAVAVGHFAVCWSRLREFGISKVSTVNLIVIRSKKIVGEIPACHVLPIYFLVDDVAFLVQVYSLETGDSDGFAGAYVVRSADVLSSPDRPGYSDDHSGQRSLWSLHQRPEDISSQWDRKCCHPIATYYACSLVLQ